MAIPHYRDIAAQVNPNSGSKDEILLCLDPGETTGVALFVQQELVSCNQWDTKDVGKASHFLAGYLKGLHAHTSQLPVRMIVEDYRVYSWKSDDHKWSSIHTVRWIGAIEAVQALLFPIMPPITYQTAQQAKGFCTDDKLVGWNVYIRGQRHSRDAIRHGIYYILFNRPDGK